MLVNQQQQGTGGVLVIQITWQQSHSQYNMIALNALPIPGQG
jgi:hypothetical protein